MNTVRRPWQGTLLGVLAWISFAFTTFLAIMNIFLQSVLLAMLSGIYGFLGGVATGVSVFPSAEGSIAAAPIMTGMFGSLLGLAGGVMLFTGFFLAIVAIFDFFYAKGLMNGKRWTLIFTIILAGFVMFLSLLGFINTLEIGTFFILLINAAFVALSWTLLKHPFYNQAR